MSTPVHFDRFELRPAERRLLCDGEPIPLGGRAFDLLCALVMLRHRVVSHDELLDRVWPGQTVEVNNLQVQVWALRKQLGHQAIATVARRGYRFMARLSASPRPVAAPADEPADVLALLAKLAGQRWTTLLTDTPDARARGLALACARRLCAAEGGMVWQAEAATLVTAAAAPCGPGPDIEALLQPVARQAGTLVLTAHAASPGPLADVVVTLLDRAPRLHVLVLAPSALKHEREHLVPLIPGTDRPLPLSAEPSLRWRPRGR